MPKELISHLWNTTTDIDAEKILSGGAGLTELEIATGPVPNPDYQKGAEDVRLVIKTIRDNEELLMLCVEKEDKFHTHRFDLPELIDLACKKAGLQFNEEFIDDLNYTFANGDFRTIGLYLTESYNKNNVYEALCEYSRRYFEHRYLLKLLEKVKLLFKEFLPTLFVEFPYKVNLITNPKGSNNAEHESSKDNLSYLRIINNIDISQHREYEELETFGVFSDPSEVKEKHMYRRRAHDLVLMIHEYAHGIFRSFVHADTSKESEQTDEVKNYKHTLDAALNEGFAILMETKLINFLITNQEPLGLDDRDVTDFRWFKSQRFKSLLETQRYQNQKRKEEKNGALVLDATAYSEGFIRIMSKLYRIGGVEQIRSFLESIDMNKSLKIKRDSTVFNEIIQQSRYPDEFLPIIANAVGKQPEND